jgi:lysophospholipase L1-like esterase
MLRHPPIALTIAGLLLGTVPTTAAQPPTTAAQPAAVQIVAAERFQKEIAAFEAADRTSPPPKGEIVFVGSSTIKVWDTAAAFPDLKIINRGIISSWLADVVRAAERIVIPYEPRLVVLYAGDNDIKDGWTSEQVAIEYERFVALVHAKLPRTRILYVAIKPSIQRWVQDRRMDMTNDLIRAACEKDDRLGFLDLGDVMLGWDEKPRAELFVADGLHMTPEGYRIWNAVIRPLLAPPTAPGTAAGSR